LLFQREPERRGVEKGADLKSVPGKELKRGQDRHIPGMKKGTDFKSVPFLLRPTTIYFNQSS
jgi:hypothetical protein